ncbi:hypothetical protein BH20CHL7_BH20CHL7_04610 [soil metagenome]
MQRTIVSHASAPDEAEDPLPAAAFLRITELASRLIGVPIAVVRVEGTSPIGSEPLGERLPGSLVARVDPSVVPATAASVRILSDPVRAEEVFGLAFHAHVPLTVSAGRTVGMLGVFDRAPRRLPREDQRTLHDLAAVAVEEIEIWLAAKRLRESDRAVSLHQRQVIDDTSTVMAAMRDIGAYEDPGAVRPAICRIASSLTGADSAALYEIVDADMTVVPTVTVGMPWPWPVAGLSDRALPVARAYVTGKAVLDVIGASAARPAAGGAESQDRAVAFWQPFPAGGPTDAAVIALGWRTSGVIEPIRVTRLMDTLAAEAIRAIERADLLVRLADLTRTDELTGLPNRRALNDALPHEVERARRDGHGLCLAMLDLDHFKRYNDRHGHPAGDRLLAAAATSWREALRSGTDLLARYGGEEFAVVLPTTLEAAHETLERIRTTTPEDQTVSIGLAAWDGHEPMEALIARADGALYRAKAAGRDQIQRAAGPPRSAP